MRAVAHATLATTAKEALAKNQLDFLEPVKNPLKTKIVSGFMPYRSEIDTTGLLTVLADAGHTTCLPVVIGAGEPLLFRQWRPGDKTTNGAWDIPVPLPTSQEVDPDILLVPMLAFDAYGFRLGYGGGFYDRTIEKLRQMKDIIAIGVAYSAQQVTNVPHAEHDQKLDWVLTEKGPMKCD